MVRAARFFLPTYRTDDSELSFFYQNYGKNISYACEKLSYILPLHYALHNRNTMVAYNKQLNLYQHNVSWNQNIYMYIFYIFITIKQK